MVHSIYGLQKLCSESALPVRRKISCFQNVGPPEAILHSETLLNGEGVVFRNVGAPEAMLHPDAML